MKKFYVWDERDSSREGASEIEAVTAEFAAMSYAEDDGDGMADGIYFDRAVPVIVEHEDGTRERFEVSAEPSVDFYAYLADDQSGLKDETSED